MKNFIKVFTAAWLIAGCSYAADEGIDPYLYGPRNVSAQERILIKEALEALVEQTYLATGEKETPQQWIARKLEELGLRSSGDLTRDRFLFLAASCDLTTVNVSKNITDERLHYLGTLRDLEKLDLSGCTNITNEGLRHLTHLPNLKELNLSGCDKITDAEIREMVRVCPGLKIMRTSYPESIIPSFYNLEQPA